jgi:hypothetical protein
VKLAFKKQKVAQEFLSVTFMFGMYNDTFMHKAPYREATESGIEWVHRTLANRTSCYNIFRMGRPLFDRLHNLLVDSYGLMSTRRMSSVQALWMLDKLRIVSQDQ